MNGNTKNRIAIACAAFFSVVLAVALIVLFDSGTASGKNANNSTDAFSEKGKSHNILFMGNDEAAGLCDVMMLVNVDTDKNKATVMQIPRDTYASYSSGGYKKINGIYRALGGAGASEFLGRAFGIDIDGYACINLSGFRALVDAIGGVDIYLPCDMRYDDATQGLHIDLPAGKVHLDGALAEQFVRFRSGYIRGDLDRMDAQKLFLAAFFKKCVDEFSPAMALRLCAAADGVETDMKLGDMLSCGAHLVNMSPDDVSVLTLPGADAVGNSGASFYVLCRASSAEITATGFGRTKDFDADGVFLNSRHGDFKRIYGSDIACEIKKLRQLIETGVGE